MALAKYFDCVVVGAGPAGIATSIELADMGWKVLLVEKSTFPRDKVCGGFIGPENKELFQRYNILDELINKGAQKVTHILWSAPNGQKVHVPLSFNGNNDFGFGFSRKNMDLALLARAEERGVVFKDMSLVVSRNQDNGRHQLTFKNLRNGNEEKISSYHFVIAHGAFDKTYQSGSRLFGVAGLFDSCRDIGSDVIMHFIKDGHVGINRFEGDKINVCYVIKEKLFKECRGNYEMIWNQFLLSNACLREQMESAKLLSSWKGTFIDMKRPLRFFEDGVFYAGDAAGLIHPIAGGGISMALNGGMILGKLLGKYQPADVDLKKVAKTYEVIWKKNFLRSTQISKIIGELAHNPFAANTIIKILKNRENAVHQLFNQFHQPIVFA